MAPFGNREFDPGQRGRSRQPPTAPPPPVAAPPPPTSPPAAGKKPPKKNTAVLNPPAPKPGKPVPRPGQPAPGAPPAGGGGGGQAALPPGQRPPDPSRDALPPAFKKMLDGGMSEAQVRQKWARSLQNRGKAGPGIPGGGTVKPPPGAPTPQPPPGPGVGAAPPPPTPGGGGGGPFVPAPQPGTPVYPGGPTPGGGFGGGFGGPGLPGGPLVQPGAPGAPPGATDFRDPMMSFLSAVPIMNLNTAKQIDSALAGFGDSGNRWSSTAMGKAGELGAQNAMQQNALMTDLLRNYSEGQENRALQASGMGMQLGGMLDQMAQDRVRLPAEMGMWEQGRQDQFQKDRYKDFEANKLGWFPFAFDFAKGQGAGSPGQIYSVQQPGEPGAAPWLELLAGLLK